MSEQNFMAFHLIVVETFHLKPQMSTYCHHKRTSQRITRVIRSHPLGNMNICTNGSPPYTIVVETFRSGPKW